VVLTESSEERGEFGVGGHTERAVQHAECCETGLHLIHLRDPTGIVLCVGLWTLSDGRPYSQDDAMATPEGMIELTATQSWDLLRSCVVEHGGVGRIAVSIMHHPDIFPVNYAVLEDASDPGAEPSVVFRTAEGTKLAAAVLGVAVAFEVDGYDPANAEAWSVVLKGHAEEIEQIHGGFDPETIPLFPWNAAPKHRFVRIRSTEITGRRFTVVAGVAPQV
jgi:hypothetical protein